MMGIGDHVGGMGIVSWLPMIVFWGALIAVVLWTVTRLFPSGERRSEAKDVLDRRLGAGEIDSETYLASARNSPATDGTE